MLVLFVFGLVAAATASDYECTSKGGTCQDYRYAAPCTAGYDTMICDGDIYRQCCLKCSATCLLDEARYSKNDGKCKSFGGNCQHNSNYCASAYKSRKCGGPTSRKCCLTPTKPALVTASDYKCTSKGGTCQDYRYAAPCIAGYETKLCDGDINRQCCLKCSATCLLDEARYSQNDGKCKSSGGNCQHDSNYCASAYQSGKCGGPIARKCCPAENKPAINGSGCYGDINNVETTGASQATANQDKLGYSGIPASHAMAKADLNKLNEHKSNISKAAQLLCVDASIIAGISSRETRGGSVLRKDGFGFDGHGYGLMQVDDRYHTVDKSGGPFSLAHIKQATGILIGMINGVKANHPSWTTEMQLKGGISAYNAGVKNVQTYEGMDVGTTGGDYANDVVARSQWFKKNGY